MFLHPTKQALFEYAEAQVNGRPIPADTARHVVGCASCREEAAGIADSLEFAASAPALEPPSAFTAQILSAARAERAVRTNARRRVRLAFGVCKAVAFAAGLVLVASVSFTQALNPAQHQVSAVQNAAVVQPGTQQAGPSPEQIRKTADEARLLAAAVGSRTRAPRSMSEWQHRLAAAALSADLSAMRAALENYPGCERANRLINANLQRQAQVLKTLYVEQGL